MLLRAHTIYIIIRNQQHFKFSQENRINQRKISDCVTNGIHPTCCRSSRTGKHIAYRTAPCLNTVSAYSPFQRQQQHDRPSSHAHSQQSDPGNPGRHCLQTWFHQHEAAPVLPIRRESTHPPAGLVAMPHGCKLISAAMQTAAGQQAIMMVRLSNCTLTLRPSSFQQSLHPRIQGRYVCLIAA